MFYIYIIYSVSLNKFYVGHSENPWERLKQHNDGNPNTFTGKTQDWELKAVFQVKGNKHDAMEMEHYIKTQKSRALVLKLVNPDFTPTGNLERLIRVPITRD